MDCREAEEHILESLAGDRHGATTPDLEAHLASCAACGRFAEIHLTLDRQLAAAITAPVLSPEFRASVMKAVRRERSTVWPDFLPDVAHLAGSVCAIAVCLATLPFPPRPVILAGLSFSLAAYFVQSVIRSSLEALGEE